MATEFKKGLRRPTLLSFIQGILNQYPDDGQILKELIQNADDAGAETVRFLLDERVNDVEKLSHPDLAKFQGAALYAYNDAVFTEDDWMGICKMQESIKRNDPIKTGRFGLGFKSIFHVTDLPVILSGDCVGFIDPHELYLPDKTSAHPWHLAEDAKEIASFWSQFKPLSQKIFNSETFQEDQHYAHTLFRFPLRSSVSELSKKLYTSEQIDNLFNSLVVDDGQSLLFLKSVMTIEIYKCKANTSEPVLIHRASISESQRQSIQEKRSRFLEKIQNRQHWRNEPVNLMYNMVIDIVNNGTARVVRKRQEWMIGHTCGSDGLECVEGLVEELSVLPWVGIALPLHGSDTCDQPSSATCGRLFASLPLPLDGTEDTGLPFQIHGFFDMEQNRRHLKWPTSDQSMKELDDPSLRWNQVLVSNLVPSAVLTFLTVLIQDHTHGEDSLKCEDVYAAMPDETKVDSKWKPVVAYLYQRLFNKSSLYTPMGNGAWLAPSDCFLLTKEMNNEKRKIVEGMILEAGRPLVFPPAHVVKALTCYGQTLPKEVTPTLVKDAVLNNTKWNNLPPSSALLLLQYFWENSTISDLIGLPLIPLLNNEMEVFKGPQEKKIYVTSVEHPTTLLPRLEGRLSGTDLDEQTKIILQKIAKSGKTQLEMLSPSSVFALLPEVEPPSLLHQKVVLFGTGIHTHAWVEEVWKYLQRYGSQNLDLKKLRKLHILPTNQNELHTLDSGEMMVLRKKNMQIPHSVYRFLEELGVVILHDAPDYVHKNEALTQSFIQPCTLEGMIYALQLHEKNDKCSFPGMMQNLWQENEHLVQGFLSFLCDSGVALLSTSSKDFLMRLPLFKTLNGSGFNTSAYVSLSEVPYSAPLVTLPVVFPSQVIDISTEGIRHLLETLGVQKFHTCDLKTIFKEKLFPEFQGVNYNAEMLTRITLFYLDYFENCFNTDQNLTLRIGNTRCIMSITGKMLTPKDFFDPTEPFLKDLLDDDSFPDDNFTIPSRLVALRSIGLRSLNSLQPREILDLAQSITGNSVKQASFLGLVRILSKQKEFVGNSAFWKGLSMIPFLPVVQKRPSYYPQCMPWFGVTTASFLSASEVCHITKAKIFGGLYSLVDIEPTLLKLLQTDRTEPGVESLVQQLKLVTENFRPAEKAKYILLVDEIYDTMFHYSTCSIQDALRNQLLSKWVWSDGEFHALDRMLLLRNNIDFSPHVSVLPPEIERHRELFKSCGMVEKIDLATVLNWISEANESNRERTIEEVQKDLQLSILILKSLPPGSSEDVFVPLKTDDPLKLRFCLASGCTRKTATDTFSLFTDMEGVNYVHPLIPKEVCDALSIRSDVSRGANSEALGTEACGQTEPLTRRLHSIIEGYTDGLAFIIEMIQNADDAGATEVQLIYDKRKNEQCSTKILDPSMKAWQGPAFWVYNDAQFTEDDFRNISELNGATKKEMVEKIGTFGLGFNAVYNVTDVPSFLSGEHMVIFDPHTKYLNDALVDKAVPGIKLKVINSKTNVLQCFSDQFAPWNGVCECSLKSGANASFDGSLFRLPFRGQTESYFSEISNNVYTDHDVQKLFNMIQNQGNKMLLFTQNVVKFSVSLIPEDAIDVSREVYQVFQVTKEPVSYVKKHGVRMEIPPTGQKEFLIETAILKAAKASRTQSLRSTLIMNTKLKCTSEGMSRLGSCETSDQESLWLVSNCSEPSDISHHQLVVSGAAIQLTRNEAGLTVKPLLNDDGNPCGIYFCFLPLPVECSLPFHLNGMFSLENSRRHLVTKTEHDRDSPGGKWNQTLIQDAVCPTIIHTLRVAIQLVSQECDLYSLLPVRSEDILAKKLTQTFWQTMISDPNAPPIFKGSQGWVTLQNARFLGNRCFNSNEVLLTAAKTVVSFYFAGSELMYVDAPSEILDVLWKTDENYMKKKTITEERFFIDCFLPVVADCPISIEQRDSLLLYGLMMDSKKVNSAFCFLACIPVSDHQFLSPNELIHPGGRAAKLYNVDDQKFPCFRVGNETNLPSEFDKLCQFGMVKDLLKWEDILERAEDIAQNISADEVERVKCLFEYLEWRLNCGSDTVPEAGIKMSLTLTRFIPVMQRPVEWTVTWKGDLHSLCCGCEMLFNEKYLVGCSRYAIPDNSLGLSRDLALFLGMKAVVPLNDIVLQLETIADKNDSPRTALIIDSIKMIYTDLEKLCHFPSDASTIQNMMSEKRLVYIDSENIFVNSSHCSFSLEFKASPFLYSIPITYFQNLFSIVGVKEKFFPQDYIHALSRIKMEVKEKPLDDEMLDKVMKILQQLEKEIRSQSLKLEKLREYGEIYMPDTKAVLYPSGKMTYFDCPWVRKDLPYLMTNKCISYVVAKALGAKDIRSQLLDQRSRKLGTPFGQKEKLLDRIKTVLKAYPFGTQMLMEFAQNADDAGASELHFILDRRTHGKERLIGDKWKSLQGPGLCIYNNATFTDADLEGIIALGKGSKKDDPGKIGQYGVGLNVVYHITDVQVLRVQMDNGTEHIIALDPTCQYVPGATSAEPGMLYSQLEDLRDIFPDIFSCFLEDQYTGGTFFRLPLHQKDSLRISSIYRGLDETEELLDTCQDSCMEALLFLTTLREIHITKIREDGSQCTERITANLAQHQNKALKSFKEAVAREVNMYTEGRKKLSAIPHMQVSYTIDIKSTTSNEKWNVVQQLGTKECISDATMDSLSQSRVPALPIGGAAYLYSKTFSYKRSFSYRGFERKPKDCMVYTSLPLPLKTNLPVNINGHFMLDHESRQHLWGGRGDEYKTQWNEFLCGNVIAPCYATCILMEQKRLQECLHKGDGNLGDKTRQKISDYYEIFPQDVNSQHCHESIIVERACKLISEIDIIPVLLPQQNQVKWGPLVGKDHVYFYQKDFAVPCMPDPYLPQPHSYQGYETASCHDPLPVKVADLCSISGVQCPNPKVQNVFETHLNIEFIKPSSVIEILKDRYRRTNWIPHLREHNVCEVLRYCKKDQEFHMKMDGLPLLWTSNGKLGAFSVSHPVYNSPYTYLVAPCSGEFLHPSFIKMFKDVESNVFKDFGIGDFAHHFTQHHPHLVYRNNGPVSFGVSAPISRQILDNVWEFIKEKAVQSGHEIKSLDNLCLLRVLQDSTCLTQWLYPLKLAYTIIAAGSSPLVEEVSRGSSLHQSRVSLPIHLDSSFSHQNRIADADVATCLKKWNLVADWDEPSSIAKAFRYYQTKGNFPNSCVAIGLLSYFSRKDNVQKLTATALDDLKHLQIFPTLGLKYTTGNCYVYVVPSEIPKKDMDSWVDSKTHIFLKGDKQYECLYKALGFHRLTKQELYIQFIIPQMELGYIKDGYWEHMLFMVQEFHKETSVLEHLKIASIVRTIDGSFYTASELFDPSVKLFQQMESKDRFPKKPPYFSEDLHEWENFLRSIGLICKVSTDRMCSYVQVLSRNSKKKDDQTKISKEVLNYISSLEDIEKACELLRRIKDIAFIPQKPTPYQGDICPPFRADTLVPLNGSVPNGEFADLVWSVAPVIPNWFTSKKWKDIHYESAGIIAKPNCQRVVQHLKRVCDNKVHKPPTNDDTAQFLQKVLEKCFKFISQKESEGDDEVRDLISTLTDCPCIFIQEARKLITPTFCFLDSSNWYEVRPFLFKKPDFMKPFELTLEKLGCAREPSSKHYQAVLQQIFHKYGTKPLERGNLLAANAAMNRIFNFNPIDIDTEMPLYLVSEEGWLNEGKRLIFNNNSIIRDRLFQEPKMDFFASITTGVPIEFMLRKLPESHRPRSLTSVVKEVMTVTSPVNECIQYAQNIEQNLHSPALTNGVQRMAKHIGGHEGSHQTAEYFTQLTEQICSSLLKIKIFPVTRLQTVITDFEGRERGAVCEKSLFIDESTSHMYINKNLWQDGRCQNNMYFWMLLAEMIDKHTCGLFKEYKHKLMVILAADDTEVDQLLDDMEIAK